MKIKMYFSLLLISFLFWSACTSKTQEKVGNELAEEMIEKTTGSQVELENGGANVTIEGNGEKVEINQAASEWPDEIKSDFPKIDGGAITRVVRNETNENLTFNIYYDSVSKDQVDQFAQDLKKNGFQIQKIDLGGKGQISGQKENDLAMLFFGGKTSMLSVQQSK